MLSVIRIFTPTILTRHLLLSFLSPFFIGQLFFSFVILLFNLRQIIQAVIEKNMEMLLLVKLALYSMGWTLGMTIPMSALLAIILTMSTLNSDQEIIAMRAGGIHYFRIFRPYLFFSIFFLGFLLWYQIHVVPYCMRMVSVTINRIANYNPTALIEPGQFVLLDEQNGMTRNIYVERIDEDKVNHKTILHGIQIRKVESINRVYRLTELVYATWGEKIIKTLPGKRQVKALRLYDGFVFIRSGKETEFEKLNFNKNGYMDINMKDNITHIERELKPTVVEFSFKHLKEEIAVTARQMKRKADTVRYLEKLRTEYHKRFALPFATIVFILAGFPLGIVNKRSGKGVGFGQAIIIIFVYFSLYLSADALASGSKFLTPFSSAWLGNLVIFITGLLLYLLKTTDILWKFTRK